MHQVRCGVLVPVIEGATVAMVRPTTIVIIDQHPVYRDALAHVFRDAWPNVEVATLSNADDLCIGQSGFDVVLADVESIGEEFSASIRKVIAQAAGAPVVVISRYAGARQVWSAIGEGVRAYLPKTLPGEAIRDAVALVLAGSTCFPAGIFADTLRREPWFASAQMKCKRELDVLRQLNRGCSNKMIARELGVSIGLVKLHVQAILRVTGARNRTEAIANARRMGMLPAD